MTAPDQSGERFAVPETFVAPDPPSYPWSVDEFFEAVIEHLNLPHSTSLLEFRTQQLARSDGEPTDDRLTLMIADNRVVASVLEWRTDTNATEVCAAFHLSDQDLALLRAKDAELTEPDDSA